MQFCTSTLVTFAPSDDAPVHNIEEYPCTFCGTLSKIRLGFENPLCRRSKSPELSNSVNSEYTDIRWNATRILLTMSRNPENYGIVNHQLVNLIDSDSVYIKNLIMRHLHTMNGIADGTKDYIISKCKYDANFVVRMVCAEVEKGANKE